MQMRMVCWFAVLVTTAGCDATRVRWAEPQGAPGDTLGALVVGGDGTIGFVHPAMVAASPADSSRCENSLVVAADGNRLYAAWLRRRPDSTVAVVSSRSDDGRAWTAVNVVDSVDIGKFGCDRPGPSIATAEGWVHVAYSLKAPEGYGVFFAHSMDEMPMFHTPMTVIYGDRLSATAAAAQGMRVAIAYEDPSGSGKRIDVALSKTQGHTFDRRERGSPDEMSASNPRIAIRDSVVALSFVGADGVNRAVRVGHIP